MGQRFLIDTNAAIYFLNGETGASVSSIIEGDAASISVISEIELLSWTACSPEQLSVVRRFTDTMPIHTLNAPTVEKTIQIRRELRIKLPDAIIAATALVHDLILLTSNQKDFKRVEGLRILDPLN